MYNSRTVSPKVKTITKHSRMEQSPTALGYSTLDSYLIDNQSYNGIVSHI